MTGHETPEETSEAPLLNERSLPKTPIWRRYNELQRQQREERRAATAEIDERYRLLRAALADECARDGGHHWVEERLNDFNLGYLQRNGSTPQSCSSCRWPRPVAEYHDRVQAPSSQAEVDHEAVPGLMNGVALPHEADSDTDGDGAASRS